MVGIVFSWMGEGLVYPCLSTAFSNSESSPKDLNDIIFLYKQQKYVLLIWYRSFVRLLSSKQKRD
jgi:hypothetical protein